MIGAVLDAHLACGHRLNDEGGRRDAPNGGTDENDRIECFEDSLG
jgi:hypothetical protein